MRLKINLSNNYMPVPIQNYSLLNSYINRCFGSNNKYHDISGPYNISSLQGGCITEDKHSLSFEDGCHFFISSMNQEILNDFIKGISENPDFGFGLKYTGIDVISEKFKNGWNKFNTLSPILLKESKKMQPDKFILFNENNFEGYLTQRMIKKLKHFKPDYDFENNFKLSLKDHKSHKIKKILVGNRINYASQCSLNVFCTKDMAELIYNLGIGQSTNSGFGTICTTDYFLNSLNIRNKNFDTLKYQN